MPLGFNRFLWWHPMKTWGNQKMCLTNDAAHSHRFSQFHVPSLLGVEPHFNIAKAHGFISNGNLWCLVTYGAGKWICNHFEGWHVLNPIINITNHPSSPRTWGLWNWAFSWVYHGVPLRLGWASWWFGRPDPPVRTKWSRSSMIQNYRPCSRRGFCAKPSPGGSEDSLKNVEKQLKDVEKQLKHDKHAETCWVCSRISIFVAIVGELFMESRPEFALLHHDGIFVPNYIRWQMHLGKTHVAY